MQYIRFPTSKIEQGTDAMHTNCDYSAVYINLVTLNLQGPSHESPIGISIIFTIGKGTETILKCLEELEDLFIGLTLDSIIDDFSTFWNKLTCDPQMRWIGPEKGVIHMAVGGVVNAIWDLWSKIERKPLWQLLVDMEPEKLIDCLNFSYITDVLTKKEALEILNKNQNSKKERVDQLKKLGGYPAYTTAVGWAGYSDEKVIEMIKLSKKQGFNAFKAKVGCGLERDLHRLTLIRNEIGKDSILMTDANQVWSVEQAISTMKKLSHLNILWIEEPTAPDDAVGHSEIAKALNPLGIKVATGEHAHNRILHKQLNVLNSYQFVQSDSCRVGGLNELIVIQLMAKKFHKPVCLHAGGVGLCEMGIHAAIFDFVAVSASLEQRWLEYSGTLHEHFIHPVNINDGKYMLPSAIGYGLEMKTESIAQFVYPNGSYWQSAVGLSKFTPFKGIMAATFAPFNTDGSKLNLEIIPQIADDLVKQKVCGIFVNGTSGEFTSLTVYERKQILEKWCQTREVNEGKLHLIAQIGSSVFSESVELALHASQLKNVQAIAFIAPSYFKPKNIEELVSLISQIAKKVPQMPFYYYHYPNMNGVNFEVKKTLDLTKEICPNIVGVKFTDSNFADLGRCASSGYNVLVGADNMLFSALAAGADGAIGISYNFTGVLHNQIYENFLQNDFYVCHQLQEQSRVILEKINYYGIYPCSKFLMNSIRGFDLGPLRWPIGNLNQEQKKNILNENTFEILKQ
ncbi:mandelate racemase muconate lactonizing protein, putative [Ichthyophthirius multifiliis]|uniref:Mandelate racemase muconate lactonizing protein, putative n=1 Tax=Ichthyophthirius multifiliis TaxID=5932 RepID=G0R5Q2_ICHMU|nr:mandelate racemase muconate lactonizing protein, putative [Ichthyophthirius multifiliis]EGR27198.1 mandelate racemase muconate lactonizing protein, putative [Ichthyophthirius multifiliis]|eukprot:XP_004024082.1 mandelate racemase muconate lactonizing protein, putative [Ichthyophthirius multifiliis]